MCAGEGGWFYEKKISIEAFRYLGSSEKARLLFFFLSLSLLYFKSHIYVAIHVFFFIIIIDDEAGFLFLLSSLFMRNGKWA